MTDHVRAAFPASTASAAAAVVTSLFAAILMLASLAAPASAVVTHPYVSQLTGTGPSSPFAGACDAVVDPASDDVYVLDSAHGTVEVFDSAGNHVSTVDSKGTPGEFTNASCTLAVDFSNGLNYVANPGGAMVFVVDSAGNYVRTMNGSNTPEKSITGYLNLTVEPATGSLFISSSGQGSVYKFNPAGEYLAQSPFFTYPKATFFVTTDPSGNVYTAVRDWVTDEWKVVKFDSSLAQVGQITETPEGPFTRLADIATDGAGHLYVLDTGAQAVFEFDSSGAFLTKTTAAAAPKGPFSNPQGIAATPSGEIYVADPGRNVVDRFGPTGVVPDVTTGPAPSTVGHDNATVSGTVNPDSASLAAGCEVEIGTDTDYGLPPVSCAQASIPAGTSDVAVTADLAGLTAETTYHYRFAATNSNGKNVGEDRTFTPVAVFDATTGAATNVKENVADLNGSVDPDGFATTYRFQYGLDTAYGQQTAVASAGSGSGSTPLTTQVTGLKADTTYHYRLVATNAFGTSYGEDQTLTTALAVEGVTTEGASDIGTTTATIAGSFDLKPQTTSYYFEYGGTQSYGKKFPLPPGTDAGSGSGKASISVDLTDLQPGTEYHYRLVARNEFGETRGGDQTFATNQPPSVDAYAASEVTSGTANLNATINPHGFETTYRFEYGRTTSYGTSVPVPDGILAPAITPQEVSVPIEGLDPSVVYHFRVIAESQFGTSVTPDQTFSFYPPPCPNERVRQQTGASGLPDCRAYELVSPNDAGGVTLAAGGPHSTYATSPSRFAFTGFFGVIKGAGAPPNVGGDLYVTTRSSSGWSTRYVGLPSTEGLQSGNPPNEVIGLGGGASAGILADRGLNTFIAWNQGHQNFVGLYDPGSFAPYLWDSRGDRLGRLPTNLGQISGGESFVGDTEASADLKHFVFSSGGPVFATGGITSAPGSVYDNNRTTGQVEVISLTSNGDPIPQDPSGPMNPAEYVRIPAVSTDGSRILMSTDGPEGATHLYMRVNGAVSYDVSAGEDGVNRAVRYVGITSDGSQVFFTSKERLTSDDHDESADMFVWSEETDSLVRISSSGDAGDTDECTSLWTDRCGVHPVTPETGELGNRSDTAIARSSGDAYFYSPEQLDGAKGLLNARNLYVYREGAPHFVATLGDEAPLTRLQVSPDGRHAAFLTRSRLTAYDNAGYSTMYTYDPVSDALRCVSCRPSGEQPTSDVEASQNGLFMADDGRAFFSTRDPLVEPDTNGLRDVYEFVEGRPQLISSGTGAEESGFFPSGLVGVSADGVDVYFGAFDKLVPQDHNGPFLKFYDARTGGGFLTAPEALPCAAADECHGPDSSAPALPQLGSDVQFGNRGNVQATQRKAKQRKRAREKRRRSAKRQKHRGNASKAGRESR